MPQSHLLSGIAGCNVLKTGTKRGPMLQESLPGALDHRTKVEPGMSAARALPLVGDPCDPWYARLVRGWNGRDEVIR